MNKQELLDEINKTKEHLANMEKMLADYESERWKPTRHQSYWFVDDRSRVFECTFIPEDDDDSERYETYNCFKTEEEAKQEVEKILIRRQLEDIARRLNKGEKIDWKNSDQDKYSFYLDDKSNEIDWCYERSVQGGIVYCLDSNFYNIAIQEIGEERLKKYLRGE